MLRVVLSNWVRNSNSGQRDSFLNKLEVQSETNFVIEGTERRRQQPKEDGKQQKYYSSKKKAPMVKNTVIVGIDDRKIEYLNETYEGKKNDKKERCRIVKDIFRNTKENYDDLVMETACGLHNFRT